MRSLAVAFVLALLAALLWRRRPAGEVDAMADAPTWSAALKEALVVHQLKDGSWPAEHSGATADAVRTAMGTLALEVYHRYSNALGVN